MAVFYRDSNVDLSAWAPSAPMATPDPPNMAAIVRNVVEEDDDDDEGVMVLTNKVVTLQ